MVISNELSTIKNLDSVVIKKISYGRDTIKGRLHGRHETSFTPQYLCILLVNDVQFFVSYDGATQATERVYSSTKSFVDEASYEYELQKTQIGIMR